MLIIKHDSNDESLGLIYKHPRTFTDVLADFQHIADVSKLLIRTAQLTTRFRLSHTHKGEF